MSGLGGRRGAALALALLVVIILEGLAALTLAAAVGRLHLVAAAREAVEGRAVVTQALAETRVNAASALAALGMLDTLLFVGSGPVANWEYRVMARRDGTLLILHAQAIHRAADGAPRAAQQAALLLRWLAADTLQAISYHPRW